MPLNPRSVEIPLNEVEITAMRAQGAGGQNVNKVSSAIHLRFNIAASSLPEAIKERLLHLNDQRITKEGVLVIKAQEYRSQEQNREEALRRLQALVDSLAVVPRQRRPTKPTYGSQKRRLGSSAGAKSSFEASICPIRHGQSVGLKAAWSITTILAGAFQSIEFARYSGKFRHNHFIPYGFCLESKSILPITTNNFLR